MGKEGELRAGSLLAFQRRRDPRSAGEARDNEARLDHLFMPDEACLFARLSAVALLFGGEEMWNNTGVTLRMLGEIYRAVKM